MKTILSLLLAGVSLVQGECPKVATEPYMLPKSNFREVLEITAQIAGKPVVVSGEDDLRIQPSLVGLSLATTTTQAISPARPIRTP